MPPLTDPGVDSEEAASSPFAARAAMVVFGAGAVLAVPMLVLFGRRAWFFNDDWDFLASRTGGDFGDLFRPHYDHWTTLPVLAYRLLWFLVGLRSYVPYLLLLILLHLTAASLLRVIMRRAGVRPWIATLTALLLVFFGAGAENILVAFQITFVGALVFGLVHLILAAHDGPFDRRDLLGLLAGTAGLLCSGVAITMVVAVGIAALLRRGCCAALVHTAPLAGMYAVWYFAAPRGHTTSAFHANSLATVVQFVVVGVRATLGDMGQLPGFGIALGLLLVVGLALGFSAQGRVVFSKRAAVPIGLLVGSVVFLVLAGVFRSAELAGPFFKGTGPGHAGQSRYVYVVAALTIPALAVAADSVARRWGTAVTGVVVVVLVVGAPGNITRFSQYTRRFATLRRLEQGILLAPRLPLARSLPRSLRMTALGGPDLTMGWLLDGLSSGRIPAPARPTPVEVASETLGLALARSFATAHGTCQKVAGPVVRVLRKGEPLTVVGSSIDAVYAPTNEVRSLRRRLRPSTFVALAGPLRLVLTPARADSRSGAVCS